MKTTVVDADSGAVRDDVEAEKGYNHEVDREDYQTYLAIQEASMGDYQSDAETLVVESRPHPPTSRPHYFDSSDKCWNCGEHKNEAREYCYVPDATRQRGQELLNTIQGALDAATNNCMTLTQYETSLDALYELSEMLK